MKIQITLVGFVLALAFIFSCSSGGSGGEDSVGSSSSSVGGGSSSSSIGGSSSSSVSGSSSSLASAPKCGDVEYDPEERLCDTRDGKTYLFVKINTQIWMAENLNYEAGGSKCYQQVGDQIDRESAANCTTYGRLYSWSTAMGGSASSTANPSGVKGVCPTGWHLPSDAELDALMTAVGGSSTAGTKLKATYGWNSNGGVPAGTDEFGFSALPGGFGKSDGSFSTAGYGGIWWSATENSAIDAYCRQMDYHSVGVHSRYLGKSDYLLSVRCVKD